jgi:HAD superfamily hydrolase (TIGR01549 family)
VDLCQPLATKAILFDIDGTLVDSVGAYFEVAKVAAGPFGFEVTEEHVRHCLATGNSFWKGVVPQDRQDGDAIMKAMSAHAAREWPRILREYGTLFKGVAQMLDTLLRRGIRLGIVSGARPEVLELLRADGILDRFEVVILGSDVSRGKPDPEGILKGLDMLKITPDRALYVGDAPIDIQASHSAGVRAVSVLTGAADSTLLSLHGPDRLISSLSRLPAIVTEQFTR